MDFHSTGRTSVAMTLPYDILEQIFLICLPENPLDHAQPNTRIAPMLLCHICSSWRNAALQTPALWSHLYYRLPVRWKNTQPVAWSSELLSRDIECLKWWRRNQTIPAIRFKFCAPGCNDVGQSFRELPLAADTMEFFFDYLSSARYLDVDPLTMYFLQHDSSIDLPRIESLVTSQPNSDGTSDPLTMNFQPRPWLFPLRIPPTLRRLRLHDVRIPRSLAKTFTEWSELTHLSLHDIATVPKVWYSLIRGVSNLQWAYFDVYLASDFGEDRSLPIKFTLPFLSTLSMVTTIVDSRLTAEDDTLQLLLVNLHLPVLHDLSLYIDAYPRDLTLIATRINNVLKDVPAVTKLTLGFQFLGYTPSEEIPTPHWDGVEKLPKLAHIVFDMYPSSECNNDVDWISERLHYWKEMLRPGCWLDMNVVDKITAIVKHSWVLGPLVEDALLHILWDLANEYEDDALGTAFDIVEEDKWGLAPYSQRWKTWGSAL